MGTRPLPHTTLEKRDPEPRELPPRDLASRDLEPRELTKQDLLRWLREEDDARLAALWQAADETRSATVGDEVHLRGLLEISNRCVRNCAYCGIRAGNLNVARYRMRDEEILAAARATQRLGYGTVVLQAGEDPRLSCQRVSRLIRAIQAETGLAVTLGLGERGEDELAAWRAAGADRYLLRFETSNRALFGRIHPASPRGPVERLALLRGMQRLGYEIGSGVMVGIPGQDYDSLADDLLLFRALDLDMVGLGPYLPHPDTPLGFSGALLRLPSEEQVPNSEAMTCKVLALTRLLCPEANIPSTTALSTLSGTGRAHGLRRGANVVMPNVTPLHYRRCYEIYPGKGQVDESVDRFHGEIRRILESLGRRVGRGPGPRLRRGTCNALPGDRR